MKTRESLSGRVMRAGSWSLALRIVMRTIGFVRNIVLARLLAPEDFGLFGIALVVLSILDRFSNTGLQAALIQKENDIRDYLDTVWSVLSLRSAAVAITLFFGAPYFASFFGEENATPLFKMLALSTLLTGLQNPGLIYFRRELEFKRQFLHQLMGMLTDLLVSIALAFVLRSAWALVFGLVAGRCSLLITSYVLHPYRPRPGIQWRYVRELGRYGRWIFLSNVVLFLNARGDSLVIGKFLGAPALGVYMLASSIAEVVTLEMSRLMTLVAFPAYSRMQGESERIRKAFLTMVEITSTISFPLVVGMCLLAKPITGVLLGSRWRDVAIVLPWLAIAGSMRALVSNGTAAFKAVGRPVLSFQMDLIGVLSMYALMFPLIRSHGLTGVALAMAGGVTSMLFPFFLYTKRTLGIGLQELIGRVAPSFILSGVVGGVIGGSQLVLSGSPRVRLIVAVGGALIGYLVASAVMWKVSSAGPIGVLGEFWKRFRAGNSRASKSTSAKESPRHDM